MESLASRYSEALFSLALEQNQVEEYRKEAREVYLSLKENPEMVHLLSSYFLTEDEKDRTIDKVYGSIELADLKNFIKVVSRNGRAYEIERFLREFRKRCNEYLGISEGVVYSSEKLTSEQITEIEKAVSLKEGVKAELRNEIDPSLIGGIKVSLGGKVLDWSILNALEELKAQIMKEGGN
jgi:F-type H+-transporting ATPase subunit delta